MTGAVLTCAAPCTSTLRPAVPARLRLTGTLTLNPSGSDLGSRCVSEKKTRRSRRLCLLAVGQLQGAQLGGLPAGSGGAAPRRPFPTTHLSYFPAPRPPI